MELLKKGWLRGVLEQAHRDVAELPAWVYGVVGPKRNLSMKHFMGEGEDEEEEKDPRLSAGDGD